MKKLKIADVQRYVENNISIFHEKRISKLNTLKLSTVLKKKNPYLFKAKYLLTSEKIIKSLTDAFLSSNEETIFGDWLEGLAIYVNEIVYGGKKSGINGIDLEFDLDGIRYLVNIKSGPNWGNSSQVKKMKLDFINAAKVLKTSGSKINIQAVNGCCYGIDNKPFKGDYYKYCGQAFWEFISGDMNLYSEIIEPLGYDARRQNDDFKKSYAMMINKFVREFNNVYCNEDGSIDWIKLVKFNSGKKF
ncbi:MAG: cytosolic protein [Ignavibacteria bacterium]|nr:cytosolic protein [Ignavibacteria bacterium]